MSAAAYLLSTIVNAASFITFGGGPRCVASLGDLDGDGRAEVVIAWGFGGKQLGRAALFAGRTGELLQSWTGEAPAHEFGTSVAVCGDVDGDGRADVAISSPGAGCVDLYSSRTGERLRRLLPPRDDLRFGEEIANAGDVDADGHDDLIVGAPGSSHAYVFCGSDGKVLLALDNGAGAGRFGRAVAGGGDLDGDGHPDVLVGAPDEGQGGSVRAFSGRDGHRLWPDWSAGLADKRFARVGISIALLDELSGDGRSKVLVGADGVDGRGRAVVLDGRDGTRRWSIEGGDPAFARFGSSVAALDDLDRDGVRDLAIGDPSDSQSMSTDGEEMPRGQAPGSLTVVSGRTGVRLWRAFGDEQHDCLGFCVANAGYIDGDGIADVIAMATNGIGWENSEPYFRIYSGQNGQLIRELHLPLASAALK